MSMCSQAEWYKVCLDLEGGVMYGPISLQRNGRINLINVMLNGMREQINC